MKRERFLYPVLSGSFLMLAYLPVAIWFATWIAKGIDFFAAHPVVSRFIPVTESLLVSWGFIFFVYSRFESWTE